VFIVLSFLITLAFDWFLLLLLFFSTALSFSIASVEILEVSPHCGGEKCNLVSVWALNLVFLDILFANEVK